MEGGAAGVCPLDMHPLGPPIEAEAGYNFLNSHIFSFLLLFLSIENVTICPFYDISQILSFTLILFTLFFFAGFHLKSISVSQSKMIDAVLLKFYNGRIGNYGQMTNSQPLSRLV